MRLASVLRHRLRSIFRPSQVEHDLEDELAVHLDQLTKEYRAAGLSESEARSGARREFGNLTAAAEQCRDKRRIGFLEDISKDLSYGFRLLAKSPGFTGVAVLSIALGIAANTAIFSVINALAFQRLPLKDPSGVVAFHITGGSDGSSEWSRTSYQWFERWRDRTPVFSTTSATCLLDRFNVTINGPGGGFDTGRVRVELVSGNYFSTMGVDTAIGRALTTDDDRVPGGHPVTVISDGYWNRRFARSPSAIGRTLTLNGTSYTILGVTPRGFKGEWVGRPVDLWIPIMMQPQVMPEETGGVVDPWASTAWVRIVARLKPDVSVAAAQAATTAVFQEIWREWTQHVNYKSRPEDERRRIELLPAAEGYSDQRQSLSTFLTILMIVVGLVMLIACTNVAHLLLARSAARQREMTVRLAIGAGSARIVRQLLTESLLLSAVAGTLGLLAAQWGANALLAMASSGPAQRASILARSPSLAISLDLHPDGRVLAFTAALSLLTGVLFGLAPAFRCTRVSLSAALSSRGAAAGGLGLGKLLVISQVALSLVLLIGAGLFVRTLRNLHAQNLGVDRDHLLLVWTAPGQMGRQGPELVRFFASIQDKISSLPGVLSASPSNFGVLGGEEHSSRTSLAAVQDYVIQSEHDKWVPWTLVGPRFFETLGIPLVSGRDFTPGDTTTASQVVVVNEAMGRYYFGSQNPVGKRVVGGLGKVDHSIEIVGVVKDGSYSSLRQQDLRMIYFPYPQDPRPHHLWEWGMCLAVRTAGNPNALAAAIGKELREIAPSLPILRIDTIEQQIGESLAEERLIAGLSGFFGLVAAMLVSIGLYGMMAYSAARRTNEIGIRLALGAPRAGVLRMVLRESLLLVLAGIAIGVPVTLFATHLISARLFGVSAIDPATITVASSLMICVAVLASFVPAHKASRVDPMVALRYD